MKIFKLQATWAQNTVKLLIKYFTWGNINISLLHDHRSYSYSFNLYLTSKVIWEQALIYNDVENKHHIKKCRKLMQDKGKKHLNTMTKTLGGQICNYILKVL